MSSADVFTREEEHRCLALRELAATRSLTPDEQAELVQLDAKYATFLAEGERRLREGAIDRNSNNNKSSSSSSNSNSGTDPQQQSQDSRVLTALYQAAGTVSKATYFWGSLVGTAVPGFLGHHTGLAPDFKHWNFINERLILGALPVVTQLGSCGNHIQQIYSQLQERKQELGMVVACLDAVEMDGFGVPIVAFAREQQWRDVIPYPFDYTLVPMDDGTANVSMEVVRRTVDHMHKVLDQQKQCVYVHCKAGKGRSWMVVMCYLTTYGRKSYEAAEGWVANCRPQVNPSRTQREFVVDFMKKFSADELAKTLLDDDVIAE